MISKEIYENIKGYKPRCEIGSDMIIIEASAISKVGSFRALPFLR